MDILFRKYRSVQYNGSNSTEVMSVMNAAGTAWALRDASSTVMHFNDFLYPDDIRELLTGQWIVMSQTISEGIFDNTMYQQVFQPMATAGALLPTSYSYLAGKTATIPAATLLGIGTRTLAVSWGRTLPYASYSVDFLTDNTLTIGTPYAFSVASSPAPTATGFTLTYTNNSILTLGSGVVHCIAYKQDYV